MRYDQMRAHVRDFFRDQLRAFHEGVGMNGPATETRLESLTGGAGLAESHDPCQWAGFMHDEGAEGFLRAFCELRGISDDLTPKERHLLLSELHKGYLAYTAEAITHNRELDTLDLREPAPSASGHVVSSTQEAEPELPAYVETVRQYLEERKRAGLAPKTEGEKQDALALAGEIIGHKPVARITKADARKTKDTLLRLPKNRSKLPQIRDLPLAEMLEIEGAERISARTVNAYISHMQSFAEWAENNGHATENVFANIRVKLPKSAKTDGRKAFSQAQLQLMYTHLVENPRGLVNKDEHKWGTLIAMFTGMRLNEVAQLEVQDIQEDGGVWLIDVNDNGPDKRLKNPASRRRVPVHQQLVELGFLDFITEMRRSSSRLFPSLTYTKQNGYGRNIGRWFNERFLPELGINDKGLVFHSLRHTMVTRLSQSDVQETKVKAIAGHAQTGVTYDTYFREGYRPAQLKAALDHFQI
ncbi:MAG: site-specific integrase [Limimaricola soesokkakensis]|uniref:site-specific integrase n=1 Tax=Limimaricola soesokkakensis TaxID=1343159 RepID=UPI004058C197